MRLISGKYRGRRFLENIPEGVRPTTDFVRESIFNILNNIFDFEGKIVVDFCAGTGGLGFEALSRGAGKVTFIEKNKKTAQYIQKNAEALKIPADLFSVYVGDVIKFLERFDVISERYDIIFFDPPYKSGITNTVINLIAEKIALTKNGILVVEQSSIEGLLENKHFTKIQSRSFGETNVEILGFES